MLLKRAKGDGIAERTLHRAKKELKIKSEKIGSAWSWSLPAGPCSRAGIVGAGVSAPARLFLGTVQPIVRPLHECLGIAFAFEHAQCISGLGGARATAVVECQPFAVEVFSEVVVRDG